MLIRFEVANFRSILDPIELSMVAVDRDRSAVRPAPNIGESLLTIAGIYGPNASGKSNVLAALAWLSTAVRDSLRFWDDEIPVEPFALAEAGAAPSEFAIELLVDGVRFEYLLELDSSEVHHEALFHYPEKKRRRIFERDGDELVLQRGLGGLSGTRELLTPRTLALSIARRFDEPLVTRFAAQLLAIRMRGIRPSVRSGAGRLRPSADRTTAAWFQEPTDSTAHQQALAMLRLADLGIDDVVFEDEVVAVSGADDGDSASSRRVRRIRLLHRAGTTTVSLDMNVESEGTRTWFSMIGSVLAALESGTLLIVDELDASLHPRLSAELVRLFTDPTSNPEGAQLVFTSHDTSLLNHLNRDEVWLTEKDDRGATRLGALAEFAGERVRTSTNLEKAYLHGRFGGLPDIDRAETLRAHGLTG
ncbi:MAG: AAA family ATPase [Actinomycetia bacterium]|nr:AAA family ATPase [Actinomycetes bacterium]